MTRMTIMVNLVVGVVAAVASEASAFRSRQNNISFVIIIIAVKMMMMMVGVVTWFEVQTPNLSVCYINICLERYH